MKQQLKRMFPELASQYAKDLESHIIYTHDEASTSVLKQYCMAVSLYPLMLEGVGNIDGVTPSEPNDLQSFSGQITNLIFLLSSQCKGAVAVGSYFIALNYYIIKEYGPDWYNKLDCTATSEHSLIKRTVKDSIYKAFKQFVWGINQPAGNRSYQSPFTNISYYDKTYFESLFGDFYYPDGTQPEWKAIDTVQRLFMNWFNNVRLKQVLTFPVNLYVSAA
jgi:ribonucleoside-triphosphate reductase